MFRNAIRSADQLLGLPANEFVEACYRSLLIREPDADGLLHYVGRIAQGDSKLDVAAAIASSDEARSLPAGRKGLIAEILARQSSALIGKAKTNRARANAARVTADYFAVLAGVTPFPDNPAENSGRDDDPFSAYLTGVIKGRSN